MTIIVGRNRIGVGEIPLNRKGITAILLRMWLRNSLLSYESMSII